MKKLVLSLALVATVTFAFGQKKVVKEAEKGFKSGNLQTALTAIDGAITNPETSGDPATFLVIKNSHQDFCIRFFQYKGNIGSRKSSLGYLQ